MRRVLNMQDRTRHCTGQESVPDYTRSVAITGIHNVMHVLIMVHKSNSYLGTHPDYIMSINTAGIHNIIYVIYGSQV